MTRRVRKAITSGSLFGAVLEAKEFAEKLPGRVNRVLDSLAASELKMKVELIDEGAIIGGLQKVANRITLGLILASLIVGAAMMMRIETDFPDHGLPRSRHDFVHPGSHGSGIPGSADHAARPRPEAQVSATARTPRGRHRADPAASAGRQGQLPARTGPANDAAKGLSTAWTRVRRLIWSWWPWAAYCRLPVSIHEWWGAFGISLWAGICSLSTPAESPPQYGFDHGLTVGSPEFLETMAGAAGVPFLRATSSSC